MIVFSDEYQLLFTDHNYLNYTESRAQRINRHSKFNDFFEQWSSKFIASMNDNSIN